MNKKNLLFLLSCLATFNVFAFKLTPMNIILTAEKNRDRGTITIENENKKEKLAIKIYAMTRDIDSNGLESRHQTEDIRIFPPQVVLKPGEKRSIRIAFIGDKKIKKEKSYRLIAEQLPVSNKRKRTQGASIKILLKYVAALYFSPINGEHRLKIKHFELFKDKNELLFNIENMGQIHKVIKKMKIQVIENKKIVETLGTGVFTKLEGENLLAGLKRQFRVTLPKKSLLKKGQQLKIVFDE